MEHLCVHGVEGRRGAWDWERAWRLTEQSVDQRGVHARRPGLQGWLLWQADQAQQLTVPAPLLASPSPAAPSPGKRLELRAGPAGCPRSRRRPGGSGWGAGAPTPATARRLYSRARKFPPTVVMLLKLHRTRVESWRACGGRGGGAVRASCFAAMPAQPRGRVREGWLPTLPPLVVWEKK